MLLRALAILNREHTRHPLDHILNHRFNVGSVSPIFDSTPPELSDFSWDRMDDRLHLSSLVDGLSESTTSAIIVPFSNCFHHTHMSCLALLLAAQSILLSSRSAAVQSCVCPFADCGAPLSDHVREYALDSAGNQDLGNPNPIHPPSLRSEELVGPRQMAVDITSIVPVEAPFHTAPQSLQQEPCCICLHLQFDENSFTQRQWTLTRNVDGDADPPEGYSIWYAIAEGGFYAVIPFATPDTLNAFGSIFQCGHLTHIGCSLSAWQDYCRLHPHYGSRDSASFVCPLCRDPLSLDIRSYQQHWIRSSTFPLPAAERNLEQHLRYVTHIFPNPIPDHILMRMIIRPSPHQALTLVRGSQFLTPDRRRRPPLVFDIWDMNFSLFPPTGIFNGNGPELSQSWLFLPLIWEAFYGTRVFQLPVPAHIESHLLAVTQALSTITNLWPDSLTGWVTGPLLLSRRRLLQTWTQLSASFPDLTTNLLMYHRSLERTIREGTHPHRVQFE